MVHIARFCNYFFSQEKNTMASSIFINFLLKFLLTWATKVHHRFIPCWQYKSILNVVWHKFWSLLPSEAPALLADKQQSSQAVPWLFNTHATRQHSARLLFWLLLRYFALSNPTQAQNDSPGLTYITKVPFCFPRLASPVAFDRM